MHRFIARSLGIACAAALSTSLAVAPAHAAAEPTCSSTTTAPTLSSDRKTVLMAVTITCTGPVQSIAVKGRVTTPTNTQYTNVLNTTTTNKSNAWCATSFDGTTTCTGNFIGTFGTPGVYWAEGWGDVNWLDTAGQSHYIYGGYSNNSAYLQ
jgi:hypothetical protein